MMIFIQLDWLDSIWIRREMSYLHIFRNIENNATILPNKEQIESISLEYLNNLHYQPEKISLKNSKSNHLLLNQIILFGP